MRWSDIAYIMRSPINRKILEALKEGEMTPKMIAKKTSTARSNISTKLIGLKERNLVVCLNPDDNVQRFYKLTKRGRETLGKAAKKTMLS